MAADQELKAQLKAMVVDRLFLDVAAEDIPDEADLMKEFNLDSVNLFEIVVGLEEEFGITLDDADFSTDTFSTITNIAAFVASKQV